MKFPCSRLYILGLILLLTSCTKVKDLVNPATPREEYAREFEEGHPWFQLWNASYEKSMDDSLSIFLPYRESGLIRPNTIHTYSYNVELEQGEIFHFEVVADSANTRIFVDFLRKTGDTLNTFDVIQQNEPTDRKLEYKVGQAGTYKVIVQPALDVDTSFSLIAYTQPSYHFPVADHGNSAVMSFWGDPREAGRRQHEGIDIFAPRGTPVVAAVGGRIRYTGERGLGGKQVWLRTGLYGGRSLYYAHLDSIAISSAQKVEAGDTLGFVGNSGNAITTSPHLHFGIYGRDGAVNPLPFVYERNRPQIPDPLEIPAKDELVVQSPIANLRTAASMQGEKIGEARRGDTLQLLGKADTWHHIKTNRQMRAFIHESLVE